MTQVASARSRNRKALASFIIVMLVGVLLVEGLVFLQQRQQLAKQNRDELLTEMILLGELTKDALLRSDYSVIEGLVERWLDRHDYLVRISATMPNGFVLVDVGKEEPAAEPVTMHHDVVFNQRTLMTINTIADFSKEDVAVYSILYKGAATIGVLILFMGGMLWWALQRISIHPLEQEVRRREEKEDELLKRTRELEAAINELESFSYSVSHDLRAPLRAIDGFGYTLLEDYGQVLDETAVSYITRSRAAAQRMSVVIDGLLGLSRISRQKPSMDDVDMSQLVSEELARLQEEDPERRVETQIAADVHAKGDAALLDIALDNLVRNAWKFTSKQALARIEFGTLQQDGETVYYLRDNGAGFDMRHAKNLFGSFHRMHAPDEFPGSGIGLAIVARVIRQHDGRIWAEAEPRKGATFFFTLAN